jgi:pimeloyl-ACP methyl ester carboxylesterase
MASTLESTAVPRTITLQSHDGLALVADAYGDPAAPPVLLLHGGGQTRFAWGGTAERLAADGWYAIAMDQRGHGESAWAPDQNYHVDAFVEDVKAVVEQLGTPPVLVGASLGGIASLIAEGESHPALAAALVLVDVAPRIEITGVQRIIQFMFERPEGFASIEEAADSVAAYLPHRRRPTDLSGLEKNLRRMPDGRWRWHWDPACFAPDHGPRASQQPERMRSAARKLAIPTLLVRGRLSDLLSEEGARDFLALAPHARFADVSDAGHMVAGDRNDRFTAAVLEFLASLRPA